MLTPSTQHNSRKARGTTVPAPKSVTWSMDDHTRAKHVILRKYLDAWFPIMGSSNERLLLIDGFAGPGEYDNGEIGSPLVMIDAFLHHSYAPVRRKEVTFLFIEKDSARLQHLRQMLRQREERGDFPSTMRYRFWEGAFADAMDTILSHTETQQVSLVPTFAFIDPFGYSDTPMSLIKRLMLHRGCEVFINFMYEEINRFLTANYKTKAQQYDALFGTDEWRTIITDPPDSKGRALRIHDLYYNQLINYAGARYVRSFCMRNKHNARDYYLFFATKHIKGMEAMKRAMWKVDPTGTYQFSDFTNPYQLLLFDKPDYTLLQTMLSDKFRGRTVSLQEIEEFVIGETPFLTFKENALRPMELAGKIEVQLPGSSIKRRKGTFPEEVNGIRIRF